MDKQIRCRRELSYLFNTWDDKDPSPFVDNADDDMIVIAVTYFFKTESKCIQPFKAYFSAIVYARCMEHYFGVNFYEALSDRELMFDDMYFIPYNENPNVYERILDNVGDIWQYDSIDASVDYFKKEFLIEDDQATPKRH